MHCTFWRFDKTSCDFAHKSTQNSIIFPNWNTWNFWVSALSKFENCFFLFFFCSKKFENPILSNFCSWISFLVLKVNATSKLLQNLLHLPPLKFMLIYLDKILEISIEIILVRFWIFSNHRKFVLTYLWQNSRKIVDNIDRFQFMQISKFFTMQKSKTVGFCSFVNDLHAIFRMQI